MVIIVNIFYMIVWKTYAFREKDPETLNHYFWISWKYIWLWERWKKYKYWRTDYWFHESNKFSELDRLTEIDNVQ